MSKEGKEVNNRAGWGSAIASGLFGVDGHLDVRIIAVLNFYSKPNAHHNRGGKSSSENFPLIGSDEDYAWARDQVRAGVPGWADRVNAILFSPVFGKMTPLDLATRVLADALPKVRMQVQMHKLIWEPNQRGV